jgi:hypothetical protein
MQLEHTRSRLVAPFTSAFTTCRFTFHRRRVTLCACEMLFPNCGPLPQISHVCAMSQLQILQGVTAPLSPNWAPSRSAPSASRIVRYSITGGAFAANPRGQGYFGQEGSAPGRGTGRHPGEQRWVRIPGFLPIGYYILCIPLLGRKRHLGDVRSRFPDALGPPSCPRRPS